MQFSVFNYLLLSKLIEFVLQPHRPEQNCFDRVHAIVRLRFDERTRTVNHVGVDLNVAIRRHVVHEIGVFAKRHHLVRNAIRVAVFLLRAQPKTGKLENNVRQTEQQHLVTKISSLASSLPIDT